MSFPGSPAARLPLKTTERVDSAIWCLWAFAQAAPCGGGPLSLLFLFEEATPSSFPGLSWCQYLRDDPSPQTHQPFPVLLSHTSVSLYRGLMIRSNIFFPGIFFLSILFSDQTVNFKEAGAWRTVSP